MQFINGRYSAANSEKCNAEHTQLIIPLVALDGMGVEIMARCANQFLKYPATIKKHCVERFYGASRMVSTEDAAEAIEVNTEYRHE